MSTINPRFHRQHIRRPKTLISPVDVLFLTLKRGCSAETVTQGLAQKPCEIHVVAVRQGNPCSYQVRYSLPNGVFLQMIHGSKEDNGEDQRENHRLEQPQPIDGVHQHLVLSRKPGQSLRIRPTEGITADAAARDLATNGIIISLQSVNHSQASLVIKASRCWSIVRSEIDDHAPATANKPIESTGTSKQLGRVDLLNAMFVDVAKRYLPDTEYNHLLQMAQGAIQDH